jgi:hypothetical protein
VLRNSSGLKKEIQHSLTFHQEGIPLLISEQLLRSRNLGQLDVLRMRKLKSGWVIEILEVKSSEVGLSSFQMGQRKRILDAQKFISALFGHSSKLIVQHD